jgi:hypothetical protein
VDFWTGEVTAGGQQVTVAAPLETLPLWRRVGGVVVMLAVPVDTFVAATAPGVVSLADPDVAARVRVLASGAAEAAAAFDLYDGARVTVGAGGATIAARPGTRHRDFRFELDWSGPAPSGWSPALPVAADAAALDACAAPGCWRHDAAEQKSYLRVIFAPGAPEAEWTLAP